MVHIAPPCYTNPMNKTRFEWDANKDIENQKKHGIPFSLAQYTFADHNLVIAEDLGHSEN